ncbi:hypothetical protein EGW08_004461 [Elysia chlorotica]|uniref:Uncharacterized protein n=1 Tax=Elysia chlorotica TaxID=188477 RepID=A0A3S1BSK7_ELYCH|nr:hypothetical protein EGW08_004461 [Elysia chlorotica]
MSLKLENALICLLVILHISASATENPQKENMSVLDKETFFVGENVSQVTNMPWGTEAAGDVVTTARTYVPEPVCDPTVGAMLISHCPPDHWGYPASQCEGPTEGKPTMNKLFPVSTASGLHFRNRFCLDCWQSEERIQFWRMNLTQTSTTNVGRNPEGVDEVIKFIHENQALVTWIAPDDFPWPACPGGDPADAVCHVCGDVSDRNATCSLIYNDYSSFGDTLKCYRCRHKNISQIEAGNSECITPEVKFMTMSVGLQKEWLNPINHRGTVAPPLTLEYADDAPFGWVAMDCHGFGSCTTTACKPGVYKVDGICDSFYELSNLKTRICLQEEYSFPVTCTGPGLDTVLQPLTEYYGQRPQRETVDTDLLVMEADFKTDRKESISMNIDESEENITWTDEDMVFKGFISELNALLNTAANQSTNFNRNMLPISYMLTNLTKQGNELLVETTFLSNKKSYVNWVAALARYHNNLALLLARIGVHGKLVVCMHKTYSTATSNKVEWSCRPLFLCPGAWRQWSGSSAPETARQTSLAGMTCLAMLAAALVRGRLC